MKSLFILASLLFFPSAAVAADAIHVLSGQVHELPVWSKRALARTFTGVAAGEAATSLTSDSFMKQFGVDLQEDPILKQKYKDAVHSIGTSALAISAATFLSLGGVDKYKLTALVLAARCTGMCLTNSHASYLSAALGGLPCLIVMKCFGVDVMPSTFPYFSAQMAAEILRNLVERERPNNWALIPFFIAYAALMPSIEVSVADKPLFTEALAFFSGVSMVQGMVRVG
jgi:hypothetical protein